VTQKFGGVDLEKKQPRRRRTQRAIKSVHIANDDTKRKSPHQDEEEWFQGCSQPARGQAFLFHHAGGKLPLVSPGGGVAACGGGGVHGGVQGGACPWLFDGEAGTIS